MRHVPVRASLIVNLILSILHASAQADGRAQASTGLFSAATAPATPPPPERSAGVRSRYVRVDLGRIVSADGQRLTDRLTLNLFDDVTYTAIRKETTWLGAGRFTWVGALEGLPEGEITISVEAGVLAAGIAAGGDFYRVRSVGEQRYRIDLLGPDVPAIELAPLVPPASALALPPAAAKSPGGATIDVLVVWTPAARAAAGGTSQISALADLAAADTNVAYANSNVAQRVQVVHKAEIAYVEQDINTDLDLLTFKQGSPEDPGGVMDAIHGLRDTYHADLVSLLIADPGSAFCGLAWHMTTLSLSFESRGFSVVNYACAAAPQNSFAHELGHTKGLAHDRENASGSVFPYAYGYRVPGQFRTIMAYDCSPSCPRVRHFANPNITYNGFPTGTPIDAPEPAYDALALDNTAATVAAFRQQQAAYRLFLPQVLR
jgi:hypothetical protein